jgi:D-sedoheptulose 7-phosphate isomerase
MNYKDEIQDFRRIAEEFFENKGPLFEKVLEAIYQSLKSGHKIFVFGNGGSAAEAQHFAAEMVNKFYKVRQALCAISLTTDTSILTSIGNDSSFDYIFSRQIEALGKEGDVALALSTSGNSPNVMEALKIAKKMKMPTVVLTGKGGGKLAALPDFLLDVSSSDTPRVQEVHLLLLHLLAGELERRLT